MVLSQFGSGALQKVFDRIIGGCLFVGHSAHLLFQSCAQAINLIVGHMFNADKPFAGFIYRAQQFIQLGLHGRSIPILAVLDQKYHQESDDGGPGIDDQLPRVTPLEQRPAYAPCDYDCQGCDEHGRPSGHAGNLVGKDREKSVHVYGSGLNMLGQIFVLGKRQHLKLRDRHRFGHAA